MNAHQRRGARRHQRAVLRDLRAEYWPKMKAWLMPLPPGQFRIDAPAPGDDSSGESYVVICHDKVKIEHFRRA